MQKRRGTGTRINTDKDTDLHGGDYLGVRMRCLGSCLTGQVGMLDSWKGLKAKSIKRKGGNGNHRLTLTRTRISMEGIIYGYVF